MIGQLLFRKDISDPTLDSKYIRASTVLTTNTKARRLGYLAMMLDLFRDSDHYPVSYFGSRVEIEAEKINSQLDTYRNSRGRIEHRGQTGSSAKPYVDLAQDLSLIVEINRSFVLSKQSKVYRVILNQIRLEGLGVDIIASRIDANDLQRQIEMFDDEPKDNPFRLNFFQQAFLLYQILSADSLYLWGLVEMIGSEDVHTERDLRDRFQEMVLNELERQVSASTTPSNEKRRAHEIIRRVRRWEKPDKYLEHIVVPRLNWMLDLDVIDSNAFARNLIQFTDVGQRFHEILNRFFSVYNEKSNLCPYLLDHYYFRILDHMYSLGFTSTNHFEYRFLDEYIAECFRYFKTAAPNSISAAQAIFYVCYKSLLKDKRIVDPATVKAILADNSAHDYRLEWYSRENDGALQRSK